MYSFRCFGLSVASEIDLQGLPPSLAEPDVVVRSLMLGAEERTALEHEARAGKSGILLHWTQFGSARIRNGSEILLYPLPGVSGALAQHVVQGPAMAVLLHQRGYYTLHASAVAIGTRVAAFIGAKGMGKSTTTAALSSRGHRLITDDVLPVAVGPDDNIIAAPGVPMLKLHEESARVGLGVDPELMPHFGPNQVKRTHWVDAESNTGPLPLSVIYVLDFLEVEGEDMTIVPLGPREGFVELIRHFYLRQMLGAQAVGPPQLQQVARILDRVPLRRLSRVRSLREVAGMAARIEADVLAVQSS